MLSPNQSGGEGMIYSVRLLRDSEAIFTFFHPITPPEILQKINEINQELVNSLKERILERNPQKIDLDTFSLQFHGKEGLTVLVFCDKNDNMKLVSKILDRFFTSQIHTKIEKKAEKGILTENTKNFLTGKLLDIINKRIDPITRKKKKTKRWKTIVSSLVGISLSPIFFIPYLFLPNYLLKSLNGYHCLLILTLTAGFIGFLSQKKKVIKTSILCSSLSILTYSVLLTVTYSFLPKFFFSSPQVYSFILLGSLVFLLSAGFVAFLDNYYLAPPN